MTSLETESTSESDRCAGCTILLRSFYNSKQLIEPVSFHESCQLEKLVLGSRPQSTAESEQQESYALPSKSLFLHLNDQLLYPEPQSSIDYSSKNVLLVCPGSVKRASVLDSLAKLRFKKFVCLHIERSPWAEKYFDDWIIADDEDISKRQTAVEAVQNYCNTNSMRFDAILAYSDYVISTTAFIQEELRMPGAMSFESCEMTKNKYEFRKMCQSNNISCLKFFLIKNEEIISYVDFYKSKTSETSLTELDKNSEICASVQFPLIVKNPRGTGKGRS